MPKYHVKKGDQVTVIAGKEKGKSGKIIAVLTGKDRVIVEGLHMMKKHTKKNQQNPNGAIVEREGSVHVSNVMTATNFDARATKRGATPAAAN